MLTWAGIAGGRKDGVSQQSVIWNAVIGAKLRHTRAKSVTVASQTNE
jgi:hypothetical protein